MKKGSTTFSLDDLNKMGLSKNKDGSYSKSLLKKALDQTKEDNKFIESQIWNSKPLNNNSFVFATSGKPEKTIYSFTFNITPIGKPRMTQQDKWLNPARKPVANYWFFKESINTLANKVSFQLPESNFHCTFIIPMPGSWTEQKRNQMRNTPHQQKPDTDNLIKAVKDALCKNDANIWDYRLTKLWGDHGQIIIKNIK